MSNQCWGVLAGSCRTGPDNLIHVFLSGFFYCHFRFPNHAISPYPPRSAAMSDLKFHDAAVIWLDNHELHGTFHHSYKLGFNSLSHWRSGQAGLTSPVIQDEAKRLSIWQKCFAEDPCWVCGYCNQDQFACACESDFNSLVLGDAIDFKFLNESGFLF